MSHWIVIVGVALVTFGLRASFIVFADPHRFPHAFRRALALRKPVQCGKARLRRDHPAAASRPGGTQPA